MNDMTEKERELFEFSKETHSVIVKKHCLHSACYLLSFFIFKYCKEVIGIETKIVIGWVNDGTWDGVSSHAWVEYNGKKVDISLSVTVDENVSPTGDAIVLGEVVDSGTVAYTHHYEIPEPAAKAYAELQKVADPQMRHLMSLKENEHKMMKKIATDDALINNFFDNAPPSRKYKALKSIVEDGLLQKL